MAAHTDHWAALYADLSHFSQKILPALVPTMTIWDRLPWSEFPPGPDSLKSDHLIALLEQRGQVRHMALLMHAASDRQNSLFTTYPLLTGGAEHDVTVSKIVVGEYGAEGQIEGCVHGAWIAFFDPFFYRNRSRYRIGETYRFRLAALAYHMGPAETQRLKLRDLNPDLVRSMQTDAEWKDGKPMWLTTKGI